MTDHDEGLTPEQEAEVRRLLADARHTEPTPEAVVARLDRVLADLAGEPAREATVVRLADRRRRAATMLVAAAASVVAVIGIGQVLSPSGEDTATSAESAADESDTGAVPESLAEDAPAEEDQAGGEAADVEQVRPYSLRSEGFADEARDLRLDTLASALQDSDVTSGYGAFDRRLARTKDRAVCAPGDWGRGGYVAVVYDGAEGWVVLRRPQGETQVVDLFLCGSESVIRSVTLPYP